MRGRFYPVIVLPAFSLALFLLELFRRHGHSGLGHPPLFAGLAAVIVALLGVCWALYSLFLARFTGMGLDRALWLDLYSYFPFLFLSAYLIPAIGNRLNVGTLLFSAALASCVLVKAMTLLYCCRSRLQAMFSQAFLIPGLILALALLMRVSLISANRFHVDEALYGHWGLLIASGKDLFLRTEIVDKPPVFFYTLALFFKIFGPSEAAARLPNIIASVAGIAFLYEIARQLFDRRVAALSALFLAFSPFDIQYAPTAFTDPLMVSLVLGASLLALRRHYLVAGLALGLAVMTKPLALFFLPLCFSLGPLSGALGEKKGRLLTSGLQLGLGFMAVTLIVAFWDVAIRAGCVRFMAAGSAHYGGLSLVPPQSVLPRLQGWLGQLQYITGSPLLNLLLLVGIPILLGYGLWRRRTRHGWLCDWALAGFVLCFIAVHTLLSFNLWDRYLLGLAPIVAVLLARLVLLPYDLFLGKPGFAGGKLTYASLLGVFFIVSLLPPAWLALHYRFPIGGDHGVFQGIEDVASYFKANVPPGSILFHRTLGWHYSFYMFGFPLDFYYAPSAQFILDTAQHFPQVEKYIVFPSWISPNALRAYLRRSHWDLREMYRTYRPDGSVSFTVFRIQRLS